MILELLKPGKIEIHELKENDVLYFLHIPKTAGVTLTRYLDNYFHINEILKPELWRDLLENYPNDMNQYRFVRGHFGYGIYKIFPHKPYIITFLREPIERTLSNFDHYIRTNFPEKTNIESKVQFIEEFLTERIIKIGYQDMQSHYIGLDFNAEKLVKFFKNRDGKRFVTSPIYLAEQIKDRKLLKQAKKHLEEFAFVGITEKFEESMQLLCYTFGWKPIRNIEKFNVAEHRLNQQNLSPKLLDMLLDFNKLDIKLYKFANKLFEKRYSQMIKELQKKYSIKHLKDDKELTSNLLERHYEEVFWKNKPPVASLEYDFSQPLFGTGWHKRELDKTSTKTVRWTGPDTTSTIDLPKIQENKIKVRINVENCNNEDVLNSLKIKINEKNLELKTTKLTEQNRIVECETTIRDDFLFTKIKFELDKTISPVEIHELGSTNTKDARKLGIKISDFSIIPIN